MRKFLSILLTAVMILSLVPMTMFSVSAETDSQGVYYALSDDGTYYIVAGYEGEPTEVVIPAEFNGLPVTSIGDYAFEYCSALTSITIPDSVTSIGDEAFYGCYNLISMEIPDSVTSIGEEAFRNCSSLTSITIPDSVTSIGDYAFGACTDLTYVNISSLVTNIGDYAFAWCSSLTSIYIPNSVISIGDGAFRDCSSLTSITIPDSVTSIGYGTFSGCSSLESITVESGNEVYHSSGNCIIETESKTLITGCKNSVIPTDGSVTSIGDDAFYGCSALTSITIPDSVTSIGDYAFEYCSALTSITIPDSVTSIGNGAFYKCSGLTKVYCEAATQPDGWSENWGGNRYATVHWAVIITNDGFVYAKNNDESFYIILGYIGQSTEVVIPAEYNGLPVTSIGRYAFQSCSSLTNIIIPDSVTSIGSCAFLQCTGLTSIIIPDSVTSMGYYAFSGCESLTDIYCEAESRPDGWDYDAGWNNDCDATIHWGYCYTKDGINYKLSDDKTYCIFHSFVETPNEAVIPSQIEGLPVKEIAAKAFYECSNLTSVVIPDTVTTIGEEAFYYCYRLTSINMPDSVTSIGDWAFEGCAKLQYNEYDNAKYLGNTNNPYVVLIKAKDSDISSCNIHEDTKVIYDCAFKDCTCLTSITIPNSITWIGNNAFDYCYDLISITIPDSVTSIGDEAFYGCSALTSITIPNSVISIGNGAFRDCSALTSITIPDSVISIGVGAFSSCVSLAGSITIPDSVTFIGESVFYDCFELTDIYCEAESLPDGWSENWDYYCGATIHWDYDKVLGEEFTEIISQTETNLVESDYAKVEWDKIQEAINNAKEFETEGKSVAEIRSEIDALENAILLNPKKAEFGDLNGDENITSLDYLLVKRGCFGTYALSDVEFARADLNRDGKTNSADYLLVKRIAFGTYKVQ